MAQFLGDGLGLDSAILIERTQVVVFAEHVAGARSGVTNEVEGHCQKGTTGVRCAKVEQGWIVSTAPPLTLRFR